MDIFVNPDTSRLLNRISRFFIEEGSTAYLVGGFVRDTLLGRATDDIDIAVDGDAMVAAERAARTLGGRYVPLDTENGVGRVVLPGGWNVDFATLQGSIEQDLTRRDFTINAMAIELDSDISILLNPDRLIDPCSGRDDLRRRVVRAVGDTCFSDDAVRLMRAVRIAAELDFEIDTGTETLARQSSRLITTVPGERIREELLRLLALPGAGRRLAYLDELGVLTSLIPELAPAKGVDQPTVHVWDVFDHSIQTVTAVEYLLRESPLDYAGDDVLAQVPWTAELEQHFDRDVSSGSTRRAMLKLAALLHDIAKPATKTVDDNGRARFLGHPVDGAATAAAVMERLRFSNREIKLVELLVTYHLRPTQMSNEGLPSRRAIYRYFRDTGEAGIDILFLCLADHLATRGPSLDSDGWREHTEITKYVLTEHFEEERLSVPSKLIDGHDIMEAFGLTPGRAVGALLEAVRETQAAGEITTREQAMRFVGQLLADRKDSQRKEK